MQWAVMIQLVLVPLGIICRASSAECDNSILRLIGFCSALWWAYVAFWYWNHASSWVS
jgi:hypothetical protein